MRVYHYDAGGWQKVASIKQSSSSLLQLSPKISSVASLAGDSDSHRSSKLPAHLTKAADRLGHWINNTSKLADSERRALLARRGLLRLLRTPDARSYNAALKAHRYLTTASNTEEGAYTSMAYLKHAARLDRKIYPIHWQQLIHQLYLRMDAPVKKARILICFTGMDAGLNMPIPCLHGTALRLFDGIAYFFDSHNNYYSNESAAVHTALQDLQILAPESQLSILGTSSGGTIVHRLPACFQIGRRMSASPPVGEDPLLMEQLTQGIQTGFENSRVFFAAENSMDRRHYELLRSILPASLFSRTIYNLDWHSRCHGTLATVMALGALAGQMEWLAEWPATPCEKP